MSEDLSEAPPEDPLSRALGYPYPRHSGPVLFDPGSGAVEAHVVDIGPAHGHFLEGLRAPVPTRSVAVRTGDGTVEIAEAVTLVAAGSNGSTMQLARKYRARRHAPPILIAPATITGAVSVYSAHITAYGSVPATMHAADASAVLHVLLMPAEELAHMNATEALGANYVLAAPRAMAATVEGVPVPAPLAYVSKRGAVALDAGPVLLATTGGETTGYASAGQREMMERVKAHVGDERPLEAFVLRLIADRDARAAVTSRLAETGRRWELDRDEIVADGS